MQVYNAQKTLPENRLKDKPIFNFGKAERYAIQQRKGDEQYSRGIQYSAYFLKRQDTAGKELFLFYDMAELKSGPLVSVTEANGQL